MDVEEKKDHWAVTDFEKLNVSITHSFFSVFFLTRAILKVCMEIIKVYKKDYIWLKQMLCSSISYSITFRLNLTFVTWLSNDDKKKVKHLILIAILCWFLLLITIHWYWSSIKGRAGEILITVLFFVFFRANYMKLCVMFDDWSSFRREIFFFSFPRSKKKANHLNGSGSSIGKYSIIWC